MAPDPPEFGLVATLDEQGLPTVVSVDASGAPNKKRVLPRLRGVARRRAAYVVAILARGFEEHARRGFEFNANRDALVRYPDWGKLQGDSYDAIANRVQTALVHNGEIATGDPTHGCLAPVLLNGNVTPRIAPEAEAFYARLFDDTPAATTEFRRTVIGSPGKHRPLKPVSASLREHVWLRELVDPSFAHCGAGYRDSFVSSAPLLERLEPAGSCRSLQATLNDDVFPVPEVLAPLIDDLVQARSAWEANQGATREPAWDNPKVWVRAVFEGHEPGTEARRVRLTCGRTSYYPRLLFNRAFAGAQIGIDPIGDVRRHRRNAGKDWEELVPTVPSTLGMVVGVVTSDDYVILTRRGNNVDVERNLWSASAAELLDPSIDVGDFVAGSLDVRRAALRAIGEEVGAREGQVRDLFLVGVGVEVSLYQVQALIAARVTYDHTLVETVRENATDKKREARETETIPLAELDARIEHLAGQWQPTAVPCLERMRWALGQ